jgi:hypothetical protein
LYPTDTIHTVAAWDDVRRIALALPEVTEPGARVWKIKDKLLVWERPLRKGDYVALGDRAPDGPILGARVAHEGMKHALIANDPGVFFTTPHFDGYPAVLVRLAEIGIPELEELVEEAWLAQAPKRLVKAYLDGSS